MGDEVQQIKEVVSYLTQAHAAGEALNIILSLSGSMETRAYFLETDLHREILRLLPDTKFTEKVLSIMINFSNDKDHLLRFCEQSVSLRIFNFLREHVKLDMSKDEAKASEVKENKDEKCYEISAPTADFSPSNAIALAIMFYNNLTQVEEGRRNFLFSQDEKLKGFILQNLIGMAIFFEQHKSFDFIANVVANISADLEGREQIAEAFALQKLLESLLKMEMNEQRHMMFLRSLKNICFGYEQFEQRFLDIKLSDSLLSLLIGECPRMRGALLEKVDKGELDASGRIFLEQVKEKPFEGPNKNENVLNLLDALILLTNSDTLVQQMFKTCPYVSQILDFLTNSVSGLHGQTREKAEVLGLQIETMKQGGGLQMDQKEENNEEESKEVESS